MTLGLDAGQTAHARAMIGEVARRNLPKRAAVVVIETAIVESSIHIYANSNVPSSMSIPHERVGTDHASVGPLQQQVPSWGTAADCMDPVRSTVKFLTGGGSNPGLLTLPGYRFSYVGHSGATVWTQLPTGAAAQAVQVSAFPDRYQQQEAWATQIVDALWPAPSVLEDDMATILLVSKADCAAHKVRWPGYFKATAFQLTHIATPEELVTLRQVFGLSTKTISLAQYHALGGI